MVDRLSGGTESCISNVDFSDHPIGIDPLVSSGIISQNNPFKLKMPSLSSHNFAMKSGTSLSSHSAMCAGTLFDDRRKIAIRGAMDKWESEGGRPAAMVSKALLDIFHETWSIVIYDTYVSETGYGTYFHYHNKWWVYGVCTSNTYYGEAKLKELMDNEFGWASIADIERLQAAAEKKVNEKFEGSWKVHVVKLGTGSWYGSIYGAYWDQDGYECYIMRQS
jgi:hypothetical protein